ncbi:MAG: Mur ligase family protein [Oscillospiraceae bacterium]
MGGTLLQESGAVVTEVSTDSRSIPAGALFVPLVGERFDGHDYLDAALAGGAAGCLTAKKPISLLDGKLYIQVPDTLEALKALAAWYRDKFTIPMVQITGSAGKTTTKEMVAAVLSQRYSTLKTQANFNNAIGTPLTLLNLAPEHQAAVIETGMNHFGEIRYSGRTGAAHRGRHHQRGRRSHRKSGRHAAGHSAGQVRDIRASAAGRPCRTERRRSAAEHRLPCPRPSCAAAGGGLRVRVTDVDDRGIEGVTCTVTTAQGIYRLHTASPGAYMIYPMAMAAAIGESLGLTTAEMHRRRGRLPPRTGSRMHLVPRRGNARSSTTATTPTPRLWRRP